ncbi:alpha/beta fold hydrolase [Dankookia sp. P2]|uniref:alpha/beta fold hydrolase n=1 Tax=Dankookia sp. P2 TaxID=3423955 RepID=UPI003D67EE57
MSSMHVDGYELSYAESGAGEPVVLVHGTLGDQRYWAPQMASFGKHYRTLALSMRHCWPGTWPDQGGDFTIDRHVADVAAFIRGLGAGPVRLVGHSRGGHIAFRVAERHPELVRALVLAEPGGELDESLGGKPAAAGQAGASRRGRGTDRGGRHRGRAAADRRAYRRSRRLGKAQRRPQADEPRQCPHPAGTAARTAQPLFARGGGADRGADLAGGRRPDPAEFRGQRGCAGAAHQGLRAGDHPARRACDEPRQPGRFRRRGAGLPGAALMPGSVLVTGGSGKAGRAIIRELLAHGHAVMNVDTAPPAEPLCHFMKADLNDFGEAVECVQRMAGTLDRRRDPLAKPFAVVHMAGIPAPGLAPDATTVGTT